MTARYEVRITAGAEADLRGIVDYLVGEGAADAATRLLEILLARLARLETFPRRGPVPDNLPLPGSGEFRQIVQPPYRMIYEIEENRALVHLVADGRQDLGGLLERRLAWRDQEKQ